MRWVPPSKAVTCSLVVMLALCCTRMLLSQSATGDTKASAAPYVFLLDVSGSMEHEGATRFQRYSHGQVAQLTVQLLRSIRTADHSTPVVVQPFSSSDQKYPASARLMNEQQLITVLPTNATGRNTELNGALEDGLEHWPGSTLLLLTDNKNDFSKSRSDHEFYMALAQNPGINQVYLVPLAMAAQESDALVLYMIVPRKERAAEAKSIIEHFAKAEGSEALHFRGFYQNAQSLSLGKEILQVGEDGAELPAEEEGDATVLHYREGQDLQGAVRFRVRSNLRHWKIVDGELEPARAEMTVPQEMQGVGEYQLSLPFASGRKINVAPGRDSAEVYTLPLDAIAAQGVRLTRTGFFTRKLPDAVLKIRLTADIRISPDLTQSGMLPAISDSLKRKLQSVQNLPEIMNEMTLGADATDQAQNNTTRKIRFDRTLLVRVKPDPVKNFTATTLLYGLPLALVAAVIAGIILLRPAAYTVVGPNNAVQKVSFSFLRPSAAVAWKQHKVVKIERNANSFRLKPEKGYSVEPTGLSRLPARFEVQEIRSQQRASFEFSQAQTSKAQAKAVRGG